MEKYFLNKKRPPCRTRIFHTLGHDGLFMLYKNFKERFICSVQDCASPQTLSSKICFYMPDSSKFFRLLKGGKSVSLRSIHPKIKLNIPGGSSDS